MILILTDAHTFLYEQKEIFSAAISSKPAAIFLLGDIPSEYVAWIRKQYTGEIYYLYGNHDNYGDYDDIPNLTNIHGKCVIVEGKRFIGIEGCVRYKSYGVAHTQEEILKLTRTLPECDILLSHEGPISSWSDSHAHQGYIGINEYLKKHSPELCIHGHRHINKAYKCENVFCVSLYKCAMLDTASKKIERLY